MPTYPIKQESGQIWRFQNWIDIAYMVGANSQQSSILTNDSIGLITSDIHISQ